MARTRTKNERQAGGSSSASPSKTASDTAVATPTDDAAAAEQASLTPPDEQRPASSAEQVSPDDVMTSFSDVAATSSRVKASRSPSPDKTQAPGQTETQNSAMTSSMTGSMTSGESKFKSPILQQMMGKGRLRASTENIAGAGQTTSSGNNSSEEASASNSPEHVKLSQVDSIDMAGSDDSSYASAALRIESFGQTIVDTDAAAGAPAVVQKDSLDPQSEMDFTDSLRSEPVQRQSLPVVDAPSMTAAAHHESSAAAQVSKSDSALHYTTSPEQIDLHLAAKCSNLNQASSSCGDDQPQHAAAGLEQFSAGMASVIISDSTLDKRRGDNNSDSFYLRKHNKHDHVDSSQSACAVMDTSGYSPPLDSTRTLGQSATQSEQSDDVKNSVDSLTFNENYASDSPAEVSQSSDHTPHSNGSQPYNDDDDDDVSAPISEPISEPAEQVNNGMTSPSHSVDADDELTHNGRLRLGTCHSVLCTCAITYLMLRTMYMCISLLLFLCFAITSVCMAVTTGKRAEIGYVFCFSARTWARTRTSCWTTPRPQTKPRPMRSWRRLTTATVQRSTRESQVAPPPPSPASTTVTTMSCIRSYHPPALPLPPPTLMTVKVWMIW